MKLHIGAHMSISGGYLKAAEDAYSIGADTFQFFTRNPRGGAARAFDAQDVEKTETFLAEHDFAPLLAHSPYTINMASDSEATRTGARELIRGDLDILNKIPCSLYNIHPGSRKADSVETGLERIASAVNETLRADDTAYFLFETMSGKGSEMGRSFEEIREMTDRVELSDKIGVCLDTCHVFCAGYDIVNDLDGVLTQFDKIIGLSRLKALHLNDTMNPFGSNKDRHAKLGEGFIGRETFVRIINTPVLASLPMLLETPNELEGYAAEISFLRDSFKL